MSRADACAFPTVASDPGLTIREYYAGLAMQAILTGAVTRGCPATEWCDQDMSVKVADALIAELAKVKP